MPSVKVKAFLLLVAGSITLIQLNGCKESTTKKAERAPADTPQKVKVTVMDSVSPSLNDTGQAYFSVTVLQNSKPYVHYEGDFPIATFDADNLILQLPASKQMLAISHLLVLYFSGVHEGVFPIAEDGNAKGKPTLIFTPEKDGVYGLNVSASSGRVTISEYTDRSFSGNLEAAASDADGNQIVIKAEFRHVKSESHP